MGLKQHEAPMPRFLLLAGIVLLIGDYSFAQDSPGPTPIAMPVNKIGGSSIWIRRRQAARPRDLRSGGCKDWRQMFHERGAEAAGSHEETRRIAANSAKPPELLHVTQAKF